MDLALLDELESEHRTAEQLLKKMEKAESAAEQRPLVDELLQAMDHHMTVEETQVYPELKRIDGEIEEEAEVEHGLARTGLAQLDEMVGQPGFGAAVAMVQAGIEHHVEEEEGEAFPKLRKALGGSSTGSGGKRADAEATKEELYEAAKKAGIEGRSGMTKDELAAALKK